MAKAKKKTKKKTAVKIKPAAKKMKMKAKPAKKKAAAKKKPAKKAAKKATKKVAKKVAAKKTAAKKSAAPKKVAAKKAPMTDTAAEAMPTTTENHPLLGQGLPSMMLANQSGQEVDLSALSGNKVVLYFYPKDDTPGCTKEACDFRDNLNRIVDKGVKVIGVSPDDPESHRKFAEKYGLNFDLLSDTNHALAEAMNVWKEKNFMGRSYMGVERSTFIVDNGRIEKAWQPVKVEGHVDEILKAIA